MNVSGFSGKYAVKLLSEADIPAIYALCKENSLYYRYCPPFVSELSIAGDMKALPPGKTEHDKFYTGYYDRGRLIAVMDIIRAYPDEKTVFIGFFMTDAALHNKGIGISIIEELCVFLYDTGFTAVRLGWVKGNPQAEHFWHKNGFKETGITYDTDEYTVIVAQRNLEGP
ncbi:MAG: GNAT family N-acetyltransferase [Parasporobacterium sp.]|nr:GNAT family N-acetyltransferase [Parasporobacterium sp.]